MTLRRAESAQTRCGFVVLAGRPNVGKSTLLNAIVGHKVAIVSDKPQTTRQAIRGVLTRVNEWQIVVLDLPGFQKPRDALTESMQARVDSEVKSADVGLLLVSAQQGVGGAGDRFIAEALVKSGIPLVVAVNKIDCSSRSRTVRALTQAAELAPQAEIFPVSGLTGEGVPELIDYLTTQLPSGPFLFESDQQSDQSELQWIAELVREQVLAVTREEVPHAVAVEVDEIERKGSIEHVTATVWVETESQKRILIGSGASKIKAIGVAARPEIEAELGQQVHLVLSVRVRRNWRSDPAMLERLGIR